MENKFDWVPMDEYGLCGLSSKSDIEMTSLEIAIIQAARRWHWAVESNNLYKDKQSRLQLKQMERSLKEACESYQQAILNELSRLGQD